MRTIQILVLSGVLLFAACQDRTATPLAPEAAPPEGPQLTFGTPQYDGANAAAVDRFGNIYVVGRTEGSLDGPNQGQSDFFVRKYHHEGEVLWADQFGTHLHDEATGVAVDNDGNSYVVGRTEGSLAGSRGGIDAFIRKYDTNGILQWTRQFGTAAADYATAVAVTANGSDIFVVGTTHGDLQLGIPNPHQGNGDVFIRKYDANGAERWTRQFGTPLSDRGTGVAVHPFDNSRVWVVGYTAGTLEDCCAQGGVDAFVRTYDMIGFKEFSSQFGTSGDDHAYAVTVDYQSHVIIAGATTGAASRGGWPTGRDAFVRKYDSAGAVVTHVQFGSTSDDFAYAISADGGGSYYVTGVTHGLLGKSPAGGADIFVRKYYPNDQLVWTTQFGTSADDRAFAVAAMNRWINDIGPVTDKDAVYVAGATAGTLVGANRGKYDAFLMSLNKWKGEVIWTDQ